MQSGKPVKRLAVIAHSHEEVVKDAVSRLERLAGSMDIELTDAENGPDLAVTLGGDGSMLRAFHRFLDTGVPVIGVNFGRVGFLTSIEAGELEQGLERVFGGDFTVVELPALEVQIGGESWPAVNDVFATSSKLGRMVELGYAVGGEDLGVLPCDGVICTADGSVTVIVDGMEVGKLEPGQQVDVHLGGQKSLLATLPERTFFSRYRQTFAS